MRAAVLGLITGAGVAVLACQPAERPITRRDLPDDDGDEPPPNASTGSDLDPTTGDPGPICGDGVIDVGEQCEGADLGGKTCMSFGWPEAPGGLYCGDDCTFVPASCTYCGNGVIDQIFEACDGDDLGHVTCPMLGTFGEGLPACTSGCDLDVSVCPSACGDGIAQAGEPCDGDDIGVSTCNEALPGSYGGKVTCAPDCTVDIVDCDPITEGAMVVTEILYAAIDFPDQPTGQWFEARNVDPVHTWNLKGCRVESVAPIEGITIETDLVVAPGEAIVFATGTDEQLGFTPDAQLPPPYSLIDEGDKIRFRCGPVVLDEVIYFGGLDSAPWPEVPPGVAIQLDPDATDPNVNDDGGVWCPATAAYALGQLGTPRGLNSGC